MKKLLFLLFTFAALWFGPSLASAVVPDIVATLTLDAGILAQIDAPAVSAPDSTVTAPDPFADFVSGVAAKFPVVITILSAIGIMRTCAKPLFGAYEKYVASTETKEDDERLAKWRGAWWFKTFAYVLNWTASIPLKTK